MKSRFAPSPTGMMHLGNARTALFNALIAKNKQGVFLLRIEDTDKLRSESKYADVLMEDLLWLGLNWQEGPGVEDGNGPYWQSQRQEIYDHYYNHLMRENLAYPCFCSEEQLALNRKLQLSMGKPPKYPGTCRNLTKEEVQAKIDQGILPTLRFRVPENHEIAFTDLIHGAQVFKGNDIGDFIIRRADGSASFIFCNAIDDAMMKVNYALRGEDHLTNTPRQIMILRALGLPEPTYGHIPLILGNDGYPLSKRNGSRSVGELREEGFLAVAVANHLARLGHYYTNNELMSLEELAENFAIENINHSPAKFDFNQLLYWQKQAVLKSSDKEFCHWMGEELFNSIPREHLALFIETVRNNVLFPKEIVVWSKLFFSDEFIYDDEQKAILKDAGLHFWEKALAIVNEFGCNYHTLVNGLKDSLSVSGKALFRPLRVALTGQEHGPELKNIFILLGDERLKRRLQLTHKVFHVAAGL
jgi:glutamyl-tRNA synthetase